MAMWSGPRNISTAMMRSWGSRPDTWVTDEPLYAHYLREHGHDHPGREEILAAGDCDWRRVVAWLTGPVPEGRPVWFQKQMTVHLTGEVDRDWLGELTNCFLIRHPREVITSYIKVLPDPDAEDLGFPQQVELFEEARRLAGRIPPVVDTRRVLEDPEGTLRRLCHAVGLEFTPAMLRWEPGARPTDGVWAPYWYGTVNQSTGFAPYRPKEHPIPPALGSVYEECLACYEELSRHLI